MRPRAEHTERSTRKALMDPGGSPAKEAVSFTARVAYSASSLAKDLLGGCDQLPLLYGISHGSDLSDKVSHGTSSRPLPHWDHRHPALPCTRSRRANDPLDTSNTSFRSGPSTKADLPELIDFLTPIKPELLDHIDQTNDDWNLETGGSRYWAAHNGYSSMRTQEEQLAGNEKNDASLSSAKSFLDDSQNRSGKPGSDASIAARSSMKQVTDLLHVSTTSDHLSVSRLKMIINHFAQGDHTSSNMQSFLESFEPAVLDQCSAANPSLQSTKDGHRAPERMTKVNTANAPPRAGTMPIELQTGTSTNANTITEATAPFLNCPRAVCQERFNDRDSLRPVCAGIISSLRRSLALKKLDYNKDLSFQAYTNVQPCRSAEILLFSFSIVSVLACYF